MSLPTVKELVTGTHVRFTHYRKGELWYKVIGQHNPGPGLDPAFTFPVPISDCGEAAFLAEDKALLFMRYIRKHLDELQSELDFAEAARKEHEATRRPPYAGGSGSATTALADAKRAVEGSARAADLRAQGYKT